MAQKAEQTLAVFLFDTGDAARRFLKVIQGIDKGDTNVRIVDAAIADRTKRGRVKVHQTKDTGAMKGGARGAVLGVIIGSILFGPAGPAVGGVLGGTLAALHNRIRDIGIDDKFMKAVGKEVDRGKSALFVQYEGDWSASIGAVEDAVRAEHAQLIHSTLAADKAAALTALLEPAVEELGGEETVADYEIETEPAAAPEEPPAEAPAAAVTDDLTRISGIGPKSAAILAAAGIDSYARLASTSEPDLRGVLAVGHAAVPKNVGSWAMQASFAQNGDWRGLDAFVRESQPRRRAKRKAAAPAKAKDDLTQIVGIGPKAAKALSRAGISDYAALAHANEPDLRHALHKADLIPPGNVGTWPMQASYAVKGDWHGMARYNERRSAPRTAPKRKAASAPVPAPEAPKPDDLTQLSGIGPRMGMLLNEDGITTYAQLQNVSVEELREIVAGGGALPPSRLATWPAQAAFAAKGDWNGLATYNKRHQA